MRTNTLLLGAVAAAAFACSPQTSPDGAGSDALGAQDGGHAIKTVFIILMENNNWSDIKGSSSAPYINSLLTKGAHAEAYNNVPGIHPSEPNYLWLEAGTNFGVLDDNDPNSNHQSSAQHLVDQLEAAGVTWKAYAEAIDGQSCPLNSGGKYGAKHVPFVFFDDVTNSNDPNSQRCIQHVRPYSELATDLANNTAPQYAFITPDLCDDMHGVFFTCSASVSTGDTWLSKQMPIMMNSQAYKNGGAIFLTWDESEGGDFPIGMVVMSPYAKVGYQNSLPYSHSSTLRTVQEIFNTGGPNAPISFLGDAANATDLSDLFTQFP
jgi:hypothetical protein